MFPLLRLESNSQLFKYELDNLISTSLQDPERDITELWKCCDYHITSDSGHLKSYATL